MRNARFSYRRLAAVCALLAVTVIQGVGAGGGAVPSTPPALAAADPNLSSELRTLQGYFDDLVAYNRACSQLAKRTQVRAADIDPLQRKGDDLRRRLSDVQRVIAEVIRKLKAANAWDDLDQKLLANTTDGRLRTFFQRSSLKGDLEEAAASLGSHANEINLPLQSLRKKLSAQVTSGDRSASVVRVGYGPATYMKYVSLSCSIGRIKVRLIRRLGGVMTNQTCDQVSCACDPALGNTGLCAGTACESIN